MTKEEAMKLALDWYDSGHEDREEFQAMIENLLATPAQEPVAWEASATKFAMGRQLFLHKPENLASYIRVRLLIYGDTSPPSQEIVCSTGLCQYKPAAPDLQAELEATNKQVEILSDALAESRQEVAALKAVQESVTWQHIESAPKDGTRILCQDEKGLIDICEWTEDRFTSSDDRTFGGHLAYTSWTSLPHSGPTLTATQRLTVREIELIDGMIKVQLDHAQRCDSIANRTMADKQKGWDMERVALLQKLKELNT